MIGFFSLIENDTCNTSKSKYDNSITLLFVKENCKWRTIHKNIHNSLYYGGGIMQRKGISTVVYWSQTVKPLTKAKESEHKTKIWEQKRYYLTSAPATQGQCDAAHLLHMGGVMHPDSEEEKVRWSRDETSTWFLVIVCSLVQGFRPS